MDGWMDGWMSILNGYQRIDFSVEQRSEIAQ